MFCTILIDIWSRAQGCFCRTTTSRSPSFLLLSSAQRALLCCLIIPRFYIFLANESLTHDVVAWGSAYCTPV
ncbi:hypothetical protein EYC80_005227 [Monilinia laxa]|uniref:Uncharacterized protein n=1 Tax=Monilinia laxa TaxID=61186 RepID=A0A5N6KJJ3_MONLA|nr:hypothetical protein EYC80_005227 [Monilinia laxa]